jgi:hypothetical protein
MRKNKIHFYLLFSEQYKSFYVSLFYYWLFFFFIEKFMEMYEKFLTLHKHRVLNNLTPVSDKPIMVIFSDPKFTIFSQLLLTNFSTNCWEYHIIPKIKLFHIFTTFLSPDCTRSYHINVTKGGFCQIFVVGDCL